MVRTTCIAVFTLLLQAAACFAENYVVTGDMRSNIRYELLQRIMPDPGISRVTLSCVIPKNSRSVTFEQAIAVDAPLPESER